MNRQPAEDESIMNWQQDVNLEKMSDTYWEKYKPLGNEELESFVCNSTDATSNNFLEADERVYRKPTNYFKSVSFDSWYNNFDKCNQFFTSQYELKDGDEVWCYKVQTSDVIPIGFEITIPYNFEEEKKYFNEDYAKKYGRFVAFRNGVNITNGSLTIGHIIAIHKSNETPYGRRMVVVRTFCYGKTEPDSFDTYVFRQYKIRNHYHYRTFYHKVLNINHYEDNDHIKKCLKCDDCYYEIARVLKGEYDIDLPIRTIVDGINRKSLEVYIGGLLPYVNNEEYKKIVQRWYFKYNTHQLIVKILCNFREIDDFSGSRNSRYHLYAREKELMKRFNIFANENAIVRSIYKCYACSADLFKVSDSECFSSEGSVLFRINPSGEIHQLRTFKNCISGKLTASGLPNPTLTYFDGYKWRFLQCSACHNFIGWRFESRIFTPHIFYAAIDRTLYPVSEAFNRDGITEMGEIWQRNREYCHYFFNRSVNGDDDEHISQFDENDLNFVNSEFEDPNLERQNADDVLLPDVNHHHFPLVFNHDLRDAFGRILNAFDEINNADDDDELMNGRFLDENLENDDDLFGVEDEEDVISLNGSNSIEASNSPHNGSENEGNANDSSEDDVGENVIDPHDVVLIQELFANEDTRSRRTNSDSNDSITPEMIQQLDESDVETRSRDSDIDNEQFNDNVDSDD
uniref:CULT domain-containing protein n=1 Tax=Parastrongyloides trichosuri TaxID=131310 RepID=A0A0N4ZEQ6_PARTI